MGHGCISLPVALCFVPAGISLDTSTSSSSSWELLSLLVKVPNIPQDLTTHLYKGHIFGDSALLE